MRLTLLLSLLPGILLAQAPDSLKHANTLPVSDSALRLPVDRASDLLPWVAGGGLDADGAPTWHGLGAKTLDRVTDGIRWASALRSRGFRGVAAAPVIVEPSLNAIDNAEVSSEARGAASLLFTTLSGGDHWRAGGSAESESPVRADGGMGISRFEGAIGGPLAGSFRIRAAGTLLGRQSAPTGLGYDSTPYYVPTGIDTTMRFPDGGALPDSVDAEVQRFGATPSVPYSPMSAADWAIRVDGGIGRATVWAHWLGTRNAERIFNYVDVANPIQARGADRIGSDLAVGLTFPLLSGFRVEGTVSVQHERSEEGPLTSAAEFDSRDPALGLMLGGVGLRWDMHAFPVDDQLLKNYRDNTPGSRRSPYDLENTAQYALVDQYRNSAYALYGWSESGGRNGVLAFDQDSRLIATAALTQDLGAGRAFRLGAEIVRHDMQHYAHSLTSQAFSDVWLEKPVESALLADWTWSGRGWELTAGARIDRFKTGASRPFLLDTVAGSPTNGQYQYFPRISSYGKGSATLQHFVADPAHTAFAPHAMLVGEMVEGVVGRLSAARSARMPDLADILTGVNTDLAITNSNTLFGTDMGHEIIDMYEIGLTMSFGAVVLDGALFRDQLKTYVGTRLSSLYDPARGTTNDIFLAQMFDNGGSYDGLTLSGDWRATPWLRAHASFRYAALDNEPGSSSAPLTPAADVRPKTLTLSATMEAPSRSSLAGFSALVSLRSMSGAARVVDAGFAPILPDGLTRKDDIPSWSSVDLRVARALAIGPRRLTIYLDARNLLNAEQIIRAFGGGDPRRSSASEALRWQNDSALTADEAKRSGHYDDTTGEVDLTFGGTGRGGCGAWETANGFPSPPNCVYLIAAEERFGNGNGIYSLAEQRSASLSYYLTQFGRSAFTAPGRAVRIGAQLAF